MNAPEQTAKRVLVVEDDRTLNRLIARQLQDMGHDPGSAHSWREAKAALADHEPSLILLDIRLPDEETIERLPELVEHCPVIVLTAYGSIQDAVRAIKLGASEYLVKPVNLAELELAVTRALEADALRRDYLFCKRKLQTQFEQPMIGASAAFRELVRQIELAAPADNTILIQGESGVGKELVAQSIHQLSPRAANNIVAVDCCTLQENLFESELFGHEKGAFTGADRRKDGLIEIAEGGTVFLDEIGELPARLQAKLLRVLETGRFRRLGGTRDLPSNVRFVAATNRNLRELSEAGTFRSDLYYRLAAFVITVPPLRDRLDDVPLLAQHFLQTRSFHRHCEKRLTKAALDALASHAWPGNIRELKNAVERAILVSGAKSELSSEHFNLPSKQRRQSAQVELSFPHEPTLEEIKQTYLARLLEAYGGRRADVAQVLGVSERNTYRLIKKYRLSTRAPPPKA